MNVHLNSIVPNKSVGVGKCTRRVLLLLIIMCTVFLIVENGIMRNIYTVYSYGALNYSTAANRHALFASITNVTVIRLMKTLQDIQRRGDVTSSIDNTNVTFSNRNNTEFVNLWDGFQGSNNDVDILEVENHNNRENKQIYSTDPFEIRHDWGIRQRGALEIFILSAIGVNSTVFEGYNKEIKLNGWQAGKHKRSAIKCCILWNSGEISEYFKPNRTYEKKQVSLLGSQITCPINGSLYDVKGVTVQFTKRKCTQNKTEYLKPLIPQKPAKNDSFAVCLKILYGQIDDQSLIYWIEYYMEMKVDKIFTFTYNISKNTTTILKHYYKMGVIEWREYNFPWKGRDVGKKVPMFWQDEQVVIYDSFSRLYGYTYFLIIDLDEYMVPKKHKNFKEMMKYLVSEYPKAAGFTTKSFLFNKNWEIFESQPCPDVETYTKRTHILAGKIARPKSILRPTRIQVDSQFHTHTFTPKEGYESVSMNETVAVINHYRKCYYGMKRACHKQRAVLDTDILQIIERIKERTQWFSELRGNG